MKQMFLKYFLLASLLSTAAVFADFDECKFNFGRMWHNSFKDNTSFAGQGLSHLAIWVGDNETYNQYWEGSMAKAAKANNLTPVFYAYVIAEYGKDNGLKDCDMGSPNHCTGGAKLIRNNWNAILSRYKSYAQGVANDYGTSKPTIWLIEPDYLQYSVTGDNLSTKFSQEGGGIPDADMGGKYFNDIVNAIKQYLPNAKIAVDISPWLNNNLATWYNNFDKSKIDYLFTSGGRTQGNAARIRSDNNNTVTWAQASQAMGGKKIIADDGYGVGGASNNDYQDWMNVSNLNARIADGVIGITIQEPNSAFTSFASSNGNLSTNCGTTPQPSSSSAVSSSSSRPSSSSAVSSSSSRPSSSSAVSSSSSRPSSSSVVSSSSSRPSSSSVVSSSSTVSGSTGQWVAQNAGLTSESATGVNIGSSNAWDQERVITYSFGSVPTGQNYTLSFNAYVSRGGQSMKPAIKVGSYCQDTPEFGQEPAVYTCTFTANQSGNLVLSITIPESRWETLSLEDLSLKDASGTAVNPNPGNNTPLFFSDANASYLQVKLRGQALSLPFSADSKLTITNIMGHKIPVTIESGVLDLSNQPKGIYLIRSVNNYHILTKQVFNR